MTLALLLLVIASTGAGYASAQIVPIPPPFPDNNAGGTSTRIAENDRSPPKIEIITSELYEGKNVFRVRITDDSSLQVREVKYVQNGELKVVGLFKGQNDIYRALIDIHWPSRIVEVTATDAAGNLARTYREYEIAQSQDIFSQIMDMLSQIQRYFQDVFAR